MLIIKAKERNQKYLFLTKIKYIKHCLIYIIN